MVYVRIGEWLIKESDKTCWIYKNDICYARFPARKHKTRDELKSILENFLYTIGALYE
jgi:hypothetical protein